MRKGVEEAPTIGRTPFLVGTVTGTPNRSPRETQRLEESVRGCASHSLTWSLPVAPSDVRSSCRCDTPLVGRLDPLLSRKRVVVAVKCVNPQHQFLPSLPITSDLVTVNYNLWPGRHTRALKIVPCRAMRHNCNLEYWEMGKCHIIWPFTVYAASTKLPQLREIRDVLQRSVSLLIAKLSSSQCRSVDESSGCKRNKVILRDEDF